MLSGVLGPGQAAWNSLSDIIKLTADINRFKNLKKISIPPCILTSRLCPWTICKLHFIIKLFVFVQCQLREESYHTGPITLPLPLVPLWPAQVHAIFATCIHTVQLQNNLAVIKTNRMLLMQLARS